MTGYRDGKVGAAADAPDSCTLIRNGTVRSAALRNALWALQVTGKTGAAALSAADYNLEKDVSC